MNYCPKCGNPLNSNDSFCSKCGISVASKVQDMSDNSVFSNAEPIVTSVQKNKGIKFLIISLAVQVLSLLGALPGGTFGAIMARIALLSFAMVLISGILCIRYSQNCYRHKGKALGIVFTMLSGIAIFIISVSLILSGTSSQKELAVHCAQELRSMLKDPGSMTIRGDIIVIESGEQSTRYVAIKYSAANSYGGKVTDVAFFSEDLGYLGTYEEDIASMSGKRKEQYLDIRVFYGLGEMASWDSSQTVSGKSVARAVGCEHTDY